MSLLHQEGQHLLYQTEEKKGKETGGENREGSVRQLMTEKDMSKDREEIVWGPKEEIDRWLHHRRQEVHTWRLHLIHIEARGLLHNMLLRQDMRMLILIEIDD